MKHTFIQRMCVALGLLCFAGSSALGQATPLRVTINAKAGLQYDVVRFEAKPASKVELKLVNNDDMAHNLVLTKPGQREAVANASAIVGLSVSGPGTSYNVPEVSGASMIARMHARTPMCLSTSTNCRRASAAECSNGTTILQLN